MAERKNVLLKVSPELHKDLKILVTLRETMLMCRKETQKNLIDSPTISVKKCLQMERTELYLLWE